MGLGCLLGLLGSFVGGCEGYLLGLLGSFIRVVRVIY